MSATEKSMYEDVYHTCHCRGHRTGGKWLRNCSLISVFTVLKTVKRMCNDRGEVYTLSSCKFSPLIYVSNSMNHHTQLFTSGISYQEIMVCTRKYRRNRYLHTQAQRISDGKSVKILKIECPLFVYSNIKASRF